MQIRAASIHAEECPDEIPSCLFVTLDIVLRAMYLLGGKPPPVPPAAQSKAAAAFDGVFPLPCARAVAQAL